MSTGMTRKALFAALVSVVLLLAAGAFANDPCDDGVNSCQQCMDKSAALASSTKGTSPETKGAMNPSGRLPPNHVCAWHHGATPARCVSVDKGVATSQKPKYVSMKAECPKVRELRLLPTCPTTEVQAKAKARSAPGGLFKFLGEPAAAASASVLEIPADASKESLLFTEKRLDNQPPDSGIKGDGIKGGQSVYWHVKDKVWRYWKSAKDPLTGASLSGQAMKIEENEFIKPGGKAPVVDACRVSPSFCQGEGQSFCGEAQRGALCGDGVLGVIDGVHGMPRQRMPQIDDNAVFAGAMGKDLGRTVTITSVDAPEEVEMGKVTPTQSEISVRKSQDIGDLLVIKGKKPKPTVISSDNYIVDGHHRWSAYKWAQMAGWTGTTMPALRVSEPIFEIIKWTSAQLHPSGTDAHKVKDQARVGFFTAGLLEVYGHLSHDDARAAYIGDTTARLASKGLSLPEEHLHDLWNHHYSHLFSDELKSNTN